METIAFEYHMLYNSIDILFVHTAVSTCIQNREICVFLHPVVAQICSAACRGGLNELKEYAKDAGGVFRLSRILITGFPKSESFLGVKQE